MSSTSRKTLKNYKTHTSQAVCVSLFPQYSFKWALKIPFATFGSRKIDVVRMPGKRTSSNESLMKRKLAISNFAHVSLTHCVQGSPQSAQEMPACLCSLAILLKVPWTIWRFTPYVDKIQTPVWLFPPSSLVFLKCFRKMKLLSCLQKTS